VVVVLFTQQLQSPRRAPPSPRRCSPEFSSAPDRAAAAARLGASDRLLCQPAASCVAMDAIQSVAGPLHEFSIDSARLLRRCTKPDRRGKLCNELLR